MPQITYSLGGTSFNAVPETLGDKRELAITSEPTIGRAKVRMIGVAENTIVLAGRFMTKDVRDSIGTLFEQCRETGASAVFNDGYEDRSVLIRAFETVPLIGRTEGFSFRIELVVIEQ
jgi:hypothetical protein